MVLFVTPQVGAQMSKLGKERNDFISQICGEKVCNCVEFCFILKFCFLNMFRLYHLVWWSLNFSFERAKSLYSCSSLGVGENVGPNREECLSCHCPPFPTVAARQPGLFHLALTVLPLPSLVLSRKFILSFHFQCYYLV